MKQQFPNKNFEISFIDEKNTQVFDVVTSMFYLSTIPQHLRSRIINCACKAAKERVVILDITPEYILDNKLLVEKKIYNPEFMKTFREDLSLFSENVLVDGLLNIWIYNTPKENNKIKQKDTSNLQSQVKKNRGKNSCDLTI